MSMELTIKGNLKENSMFLMTDLLPKIYSGWTSNVANADLLRSEKLQFS